MQLGQHSEKSDMTAAEVPAAGSPSTQATRHWLFSAMKNEAPFLLEWVAYHRVIGFDEIVVAANPSTDGTNEILAALAENGVLTYLPVTPAEGQSAQAAAAQAFTREVGYREGDWYMWLDADEFLNVHIGEQRLQDLVSAVGEMTGILVNWRIFGANGNQSFPGRFVSDDFIGASAIDFEENLEVKTLFRKDAATSGFASFGLNRPRLSRGQGAECRFLTGSGAELFETRPYATRWRRGADTGRTNRIPAEQRGWQLAQINHYSVRTPEFFTLKRLRGRGSAAGYEAAANTSHTASFFVRYDRNECEDRSILAWEDATAREIARLQAMPGVADAVNLAKNRISEDLQRAADMPKVADAETPTVKRNRRGAPSAGEVDGFKITFPHPVAAFVTDTYSRATSIVEYGSGGSTMIAASLGRRVVSVENDAAWAQKMRATLAAAGRETAEVFHADIGPTKGWGFPRDNSGFRLYHRYALAVWDHPALVAPDVVLIDGRFRKACFAATVLRTRQPVTVLFDDYTDRPGYHVVERLFPVIERVERMAVFHVTPQPIPGELLTELIGWFVDPE